MNQVKRVDGFGGKDGTGSKGDGIGWDGTVATNEWG